MHGLARLVLKSAERAPLLRKPFSLAYDAYFARASGQTRIFRGVYPNVAAAAQTIPPGRVAGYDNKPSAQRLLHEQSRILSSDYPVLFWLSRLLPTARFIFDWGGYVGITYLSYRRYLEYRDEMVWLVNDVPAVVELGREIAVEQKAQHLRFTTDLSELKDADVLLAAGSLHFIEDPLTLLKQTTLPPHILLNKVPVYDQPSTVTLQNMGTAFCPNHLFNRDELLNLFAKLGYRLVDSWTIESHGCYIPFHRSHSIAAYSGFYLTRIESR